ncbi:hypothetical protein MKX01_039824 [Papaver californicum]|nr:hypothetical protein MKX01_039824 [Papaver californicum]
MAPARKSFPANTLQHFTHSHTLTRESFDQYQNNEILCNACNTNIDSGVFYRCKQCNFNLHEYCADCPEYLDTYLHLNHQLELMWDGSDSIKKDYGQLRPCGICGDQVKGLFYICSSGAEKRHDDGRHFFFIHPLCSKFPSQMRHPIDENHPLKFQSVPAIPGSVCAICSGVVSASLWSYRCDPCGVNIHIECVTLPFDNHQYSPRSLKMLQQKGSPKLHQQKGSPKMHQQKGPVHPPVSPTHGNYAGMTPFTAPPQNNYHPNPPPNYNYCYPQPYGPSPPYNNYHQPLAPPNNGTTSSTGGKKNSMASAAAGVMGKIAVSLFLSAALGEVMPS